MENKTTENTTEERLPWNKPEVQTLTIKLDTAILTGLQSNQDMAGEG